jgi:hypothetical protein
MPELYMGVLKPPYTSISPAPMEMLVPSIGLYISLAVGIAGAPAGVLTFGEEKTVFFREAAAGHSRLAYYIAKSLSVMYRFTLGALHFVAVFHVIGEWKHAAQPPKPRTHPHALYFFPSAKPFTPFGTLYTIVWVQFLAVYGLGECLCDVHA